MPAQIKEVPFTEQTEKLIRMMFYLVVANWIVTFLIGMFLLAVSARTCQAADKWTNEDIGREVAWEVLHVIDWGQTRDISKRYDEGYYEAGPARIFIGERPSTGQVDVYMAASALLHPVITHCLPHRADIFGYRFDPRSAWQWVSIGMSAGCVARNLSIGLNINF